MIRQKRKEGVSKNVKVTQYFANVHDFSCDLNDCKQ